jgi:flagellar biosynthesis protein FlhB
VKDVKEKTLFDKAFEVVVHVIIFCAFIFICVLMVDLFFGRGHHTYDDYADYRESGYVEY